jgi:molybdenum cofactor cytidylyltransferase
MSEELTSESAVAAIVLAAGGSSRYGSLKQLHVWQGETLVRRAARLALAAATVTEVVVVLGHRHSDVAAALGDLPVRRTFNARHAEGQSTSIQAGLRALAPGVGAALVLPCDMPWLRPQTLDRLIDAWRRSGGWHLFVAPTYDGRRGAPVLASREAFAAIDDLRGDIGARVLFAQAGDRLLEVAIEDAAEGRDLDTPD